MLQSMHFKMPTILIITCCYVILNILPPFNAQYIQPGLCDTRCHCPKDENVVHCDRQDHLQGVPTNIPNGVTKLFIQHSNFPTPNYLNEANMTGLEQLEYLRIIYCNLQIIESRTFIKMVALKHLDLSYNSLIRLESYTFYGLQLHNLYLREQHSLPEQGMFISDDAFHGLSAMQINLRGNRIQSISYELFSKVPSLDRLILSDNRIIHIDNGFERYFNHPNRLLDLTGNPLECNCQLAWIAQRSMDWKDSLPGLNMTCIYWSRAENSMKKTMYIYELVKLTADQLCPTSRIQQIFINILDDASRALISCTAVTVPKRSSNYIHHKNMITASAGILSHTPPGVAWRYIEDGQLREVKRLITTNDKSDLNNHSPINDDLYHQTDSTTTIEHLTSTVQLNVSLGIKPHKYTCTTWDDKKETEEVVVTLKGPNLFHSPKLTNNNNTLTIEHEPVQSSMNDRNYQHHTKQQQPQPDDLLIRNEILYEQTNYLYQKQFTLLEMAIAVICTFLTTLIFLLIGAKCLNLCRQHTLFGLSSSCNSLDLNHNNNSSGHHNHSKIEYNSGKLIQTKSNFIEQDENRNNNNNNTSLKVNGILSSGVINENEYNLMRTHSNPYSQMFLSTLHNHTNHTTYNNNNSSTIAGNTNTGNNNFSSQLNQYPNLVNPYLTVTCTGNYLPGPPRLPSPQLLSAAAAAATTASSSLSSTNQPASSSISGTDDLQQSLALLTSTPLIQQNKLRNLLNSTTTNNTTDNNNNHMNNSSVGMLSPFLSNNQPHLANWLVAPGSPYSMTGSHVYDVPRTLEINQATLPTMSTGCLVNRSSLFSESE
ncbi:unnamed protein product [Schistosoma turkestanicum]|nr:unnamed protein product [Schistosoma turkestanicum]